MMAYDIFGQPLERGHCEVHPWHRGEYPCDRCQEEYYAYEMERARQAEWDYHYELEAFWLRLSGPDDPPHPMEEVTGGD